MSREVAICAELERAPIDENVASAEIMCVGVLAHVLSLIVIVAWSIDVLKWSRVFEGKIDGGRNECNPVRGLSC